MLRKSKALLLLRRLALALPVLCTLTVLAHGDPQRIPLRVDAPEGLPKGTRLGISGGIPFPRGALRDVAQIRVLAGKVELPIQAASVALWPDASIKWARIHLVRAEGDGPLTLEYGDGVTRQAVARPLSVRKVATGFEIRGPALKAHVGKLSGTLDRLTIGDRAICSKRKPLRPVLEALRLSGPAELGVGARVCGAEAGASAATVVVDEIAIEAPGPIYVRVLVRGHFKLSGWGATLPARVLARDPAGQVPFSLRFGFFRDLPLVLIDHQLVYTGEPDLDLITRWGFDLPGQGGGSRRAVSQPGLCIETTGTSSKIVAERLCWNRLTDGLAVIRDGWENRPCALGGARGKTAKIELWPREAGPWDLRRYAREWAVGETGNRESRADIERYARYAARGLAKSHQIALYFDPEADRDTAASLAGPALLVAPPGWYASTKVFGHYRAELRTGPYAPLELGLRRYLDYFRFNQDLYGWYGKLSYGFWQSRNGETHRSDRWNRDYGRWGWSLGDGAGRTSHTLMLTYLRTLDRRYLLAGEASCRALFDTSMVHTAQHLENARDSWWSVRGSSHRHNVQPFGCPYIGLRGSYPYGQRILYLLTGDGVIRDGIELVAQAALDRRMGASGGTDGQGAGAIALLFKWEVTGQAKYRDALLELLRRGKLFTAGEAGKLGYGPSFGLLLAGSEALDLTSDPALKAGLLALAQRGLQAKTRGKFIPVLADAARLTGEARYREALSQAVASLDMTGSLAELPIARWPGHGGPRTPPSRANIGRDLPYALALLTKKKAKVYVWPKATPDPVRLPATVPRDWWRPSGGPGRRDVAPKTKSLLAKRTPRAGGAQRAGGLRWRIDQGKLTGAADDKAERIGAIEPFVRRARRDASGNWLLSKPRSKSGAGRWGKSGNTLIGSGTIDGVRWVVTITGAKAGGVGSARISMAVEPPRGVDVASFGLRLPLRSPGKPNRVLIHAAGAFRVERWRADSSDEKIPEWRNSDSRTRWPLWRSGGLLLGRGNSYRIFKRNRDDTSALFVDQGVGAPGWLDLIDQQAGFGCTVRMLRDADDPQAICGASYTLEDRALILSFRALAATPREGAQAGAADVIAHDGWRPPLLEPDLSREQYRKMLDDLDYGGNIGLFALRFLLSTTHQVSGDQWKQRLAASGAEPRELLLSMQFRDGLKKHCERIGVRFDPQRPDATVQLVIKHYRR